VILYLGNLSYYYFCWSPGERGSQITERLQRDLIPTLKGGLMYWPACDFITYRYIPVHLQVLSNLICPVDCKVHGQDLSSFCVECNNCVVVEGTRTLQLPSLSVIFNDLCDLFTNLKSRDSVL
jgi:hypothetical protein